MAQLNFASEAFPLHSNLPRRVDLDCVPGDAIPPEQAVASKQDD
jgi:hypothetical protein